MEPPDLQAGRILARTPRNQKTKCHRRSENPSYSKREWTGSLSDQTEVPRRSRRNYLFSVPSKSLMRDLIRILSTIMTRLILIYLTLKPTISRRPEPMLE